jgi:hypothetical protein
VPKRFGVESAATIGLSLGKSVFQYMALMAAGRVQTGCFASNANSQRRVNRRWMNE